MGCELEYHMMRIQTLLNPILKDKSKILSNFSVGVK